MVTTKAFLIFIKIKMSDFKYACVLRYKCLDRNIPIKFIFFKQTFCVDSKIFGQISIKVV